MVIIAQISYPPESAKDMAKRFLEAPKFPDYMSRKGPYINSNMDKGIITLSLFELEKAKTGEGLEALGNYYATFFGVSGFKYKIETFFDVNEALKMIGMG